ncbi:hypothetical protein LD119_00332 [Mesoplasma sp. JKS002660]|uniref:ATP-binding protein n=1 Tax=Mesoplasma whartonense TaxID=2878854 RepID=UPI0020229EC5|nr:ATP-binding protein [Mesoplasma sp. JKS002660]MCL8213404.1 hypothetical protein [Mesoplasma sp. JKS002660]
MENEILRDNIPLTKSHLKEFKSMIKSEEYFMLSELIDNSLSSYIRHTIDFKNEKGEYDEKGFIKKIDNFIVEINYKKGKTPKDNTITIIDNAYGIKPENIREVLTPGGNTNSKDSRLNVYGMGLKQAAWWSGQCLKILTKRDELVYSSFTEIDLDNGEPSDEVTFDVVTDERKIRFIYDNNEFYKHGTRIEISKLNSNHYQKLSEQIISLAKEQNNIDLFATSREITVPAISLKYKKWIEKGMKIIFSYTDENDSNNDDWLLLDTNSFNIPVEQPVKTLRNYIDTIYRENKNYRDKYNSEEEFFIAVSRVILDDIKNYSGGETESYQLAKDILLNYNEKENFEMKEKMKLDIPGLGEQVFVELKYISSLEKRSHFFSRYRGLYVYDNDRAIYTGPNKKGAANEQGFGTYDIYPEGSVTRDNELNLRYLFGEMDIDSLIAEEIIRLDSNKRGIITNEGGTKSFSNAISNAAKGFTSKYAPLITKINKWFSSTKEEKQPQSTLAESGKITHIAISQTPIADTYIWDDSTKTITETKTREEAKEIIKNSSDKQSLAKVTLRLDLRKEEIFLSTTEEAGKKYSYPYRYDLEYDQEKHREVYIVKLNVQSVLFMPSLNEIDSDSRIKAKESMKATFYKMSWIDILSDIIINRHLEYSDSNVSDDDFFSLVYKKFDGNLFEIKNFLVGQVFNDND